MGARRVSECPLLDYPSLGLLRRDPEHSRPVRSPGSGPRARATQPHLPAARGTDAPPESQRRDARAESDYDRRVLELPQLTVTLRGHLTADALRAELTRVEPTMKSERTGLIVDARQMTSYDDAARDLFVDWNSRNRSRIARVAIVTDKLLWRMVISAMGLAARQEMKSFAAYSDALVWASAPERSREPIKLEVRTGRLIELRIRKLTLIEIPLLVRLIAQGRQRTLNQGIVAIADVRALKTMSQGVFDHLVAVLHRNNPGVVRIAVLAPQDDGLVGSQFARALHLAANPNRRAFQEPREAQAWLSEVLTPEEQTRLAEFLREDDQAF